MLIVLGLDGLEWETVNVLGDITPTLSEIRRTWRSVDLHIDGIPHSAPSWSTIWTGLPWETHGIYDFERHNADGSRGEKFKPSDLKYPYVWELLSDAGYDARAFSIYNFLPPVTYACSFDQDLAFQLTITLDEMTKATRQQNEMLAAMVKMEPDFIAMTTIVLDKAHHISSKKGMGNVQGALPAYQLIDSWVGEVLQRYAKHDIAFVSDHGLPSGPYIHKDGFRQPAHHPTGIFATNATFPDSLPTSSLYVTDWILEYFGVLAGPRKEVSLDRQQMSGDDGYTDDEMQIIENRLRELGYLE